MAATILLPILTDEEMVEDLMQAILSHLEDDESRGVQKNWELYEL